MFTICLASLCHQYRHFLCHAWLPIKSLLAKVTEHPKDIVAYLIPSYTMYGFVIYALQSIKHAYILTVLAVQYVHTAILKRSSSVSTFCLLVVYLMYCFIAKRDSTVPTFNSWTKCEVTAGIMHDCHPLSVVWMRPQIPDFINERKLRFASYVGH